MDCLSDMQVAWLVQGGVDHADRASLIDHVAACETCQALVSESMGHVEDEPLRFGRYEMLRAVAGGGMGTVFCAYDPVLRRLVAIKIIAEADHDAREREQMLREARALASLRHENVVAIHDVGIVDDELFLAMEFVEGVSLQIAMHRLVDDASRLGILADITRGLAALHATGLVHRDIKPSNVMVTPAGKAILLDLGLAAARGDELVAAGSPGYVAPEVLAGEAATPASDQYAWWRIVAVLFGASRLARNQRDELAAAIARGSAEDPGERFPSIEQAHEAVRAIVQPAVKRRRSWLWAAVTVAVAASVAIYTVHASRMNTFAACATLDGWDATAREAVGRIVRAHGFDDAKTLNVLDARATELGHQLEAACAREPTITTDRERLCSGLVWRENLQHVRTIERDASKERVALALDGIARALPPERCEGGTAPSQPAAPTAVQAATYSTLRDQIDAAAGHQGAKSVAALDALRPAIDANGFPGLVLAWSSAMIGELIFIGDYKRARIVIEAARHLAQVTGDDVQLGWLMVTRLRLATFTRQATDEIEADVDAIVTRVGSPLLTAEAFQARAERDFAFGNPQHAVELLDKAIEIYTAVSIVPSPGLRSAYMTRAASLQTLGKLEQAQADLERSYAVAVQRYPKGSAELQETEGARASNLMYLGKLDEAAVVFRDLRDALVATHRDRTATAAHVALYLCQIAMVERAPTARDICTEAVATGAAVHGADSAANISVRNALAQVLVEADPRAAIALLEESLRIGVNGGAQPLDVPYAQGLLALADHAVKRHAAGCTVAATALVALRNSPQVDMVNELEQVFPELKQGGHCR